MVNPEEIYARLASASPAQIWATAEALATTADTVRESARSTDAATNAAQGWTGEAADAYARRVDAIVDAASLAEANIAAAQQALERVARTCEEVRQRADRVIEFWRVMVTMTAGAGLRELAAALGGELRRLADVYNDQLRAQAVVLRRLTPAFARTTATVPPPGSDPADVARWWTSLTEQQRNLLLVTEFERLGTLAGLPAKVLDVANRRRIDADRTRYAGRRAANADAAARNLEQAVNNAADNHLPADEIYVLSYSPDGPGRKEGTLAVAFGNPDTAGNVAVTVPGTGTTIGSDFTGHAANLRGEMGAEGNATIAWLGYDAPVWDLSVASDLGATDGGPRLASDVEGYRAAAEAAGTPRQHVTVIGHSYGSTTVGYAGMSGLDADDIAVVGSPGVGTSDAGQLGGATVWAGGNEHDPVIQATNGSYFTEDGSTGPYDPAFGARQFDTDADVGTAGAHSAYYDHGSDSLRNLARIAAGDDSAVTERSYLEAPIAPGGDLPMPGASTVYRLGYEHGQVVGDLVTGDLTGAVRDAADGVATVIGGATGILR